MRISGIASGFDTETMIKELMNAERLRINRYYQQEQTLKWRQEAYNTTNRTMANFILNTRKDLGLSEIMYNGTIRSNATNNFTWVKRAFSSDESSVSAVGKTNAINGSYQVKVNALAENAAATSQQLAAGSNEADGENFVLDSNLKFKGNDTITVTTDVGSIEINVGPDGDVKDINGFVSALNRAVDGDGKSLGIQASYDRSLGKLIVTTRDSGANKFIQVSSNGDTAGKMFTGDILGAGVTGADASITFNGDEITSSTNNFSVFGIDITAKKITSAEVTIKVDTNVDGIFEKIKGFVDSYNELVDTINGTLNEKTYRDYKPLTQEEKAALSDKEIEAWEKKAKSGLLKNNESLSRTLQSIRGSLYQPIDGVTGTYDYLHQLGITTGNYKDGGKLVIDEEKLRKAITEDPNGVMDVFFKTPEMDSTGEERTATSGIIQRVYDGLVTGMKDIVKQSGTGADENLLRNVQSNMLVEFVSDHSSLSKIDKDLRTLSTNILREERLLMQKENRYWQKFTAMEKALSQMNQQSNWLMSQLGLS